MAGGVRTIYVDLDQTLVRVDLLQERLLVAIVRNPLILFQAIFWFLSGGHVRLKTEIAARCSVDAIHLPYNEELLSFLREERRAGLSLVLATSAPYAWAYAVARHLNIFDRVLATDEAHGNLKGERKLAIIQQDSGGGPFGYVGDAPYDRPIFEAAQLPIVIGRDISLAGTQANKAILLRPKTDAIPAWLRSVRPYMWSKNILIFAPAIAAHQLGQLWPNAFLAFLAFSLAASALYLLNDLLDIDIDRKHPDKRDGPQASGAFCPSRALALAIGLLIAAAAFAACLPPRFSLFLLGYVILNLLYSAVVKYVVVLDLLALAFLYLLRVFAGGAACHAHGTVWLFAFVFFLGLSLAHLKRYIEMAQQLKEGSAAATRPIYPLESMALLMKVGLSSGLISVLVLCLYVTAPQTAPIYKTPALLFIFCLFIFYWIENIWRAARRGNIPGDPIYFIVTDYVTYLVGLGSMAVVWLASVY